MSTIHIAILLGIVIAVIIGLSISKKKSDPEPYAHSTTLEDVVLNTETFKKLYHSTIPLDGACTFRFECQILFKDFFVNRNNGHIAIITRCDTEISNKIWGAGLAIGRISPTNPDEPKALIESWSGINPNDHWLYPETLSFALVDNVPVKLVLYTTVDESNKRYARYLISQGSDTYDSGLLLDNNNDYDTAKDGLAVAYDRLESGSVEFTSMVCTRLPYSVDANTYAW